MGSQLFLIAVSGTTSMGISCLRTSHFLAVFLACTTLANNHMIFIKSGTKSKGYMRHVEIWPLLRELGLYNFKQDAEHGIKNCTVERYNSFAGIWFNFAEDGLKSVVDFENLRIKKIKRGAVTVSIFNLFGHLFAARTKYDATYGQRAYAANYQEAGLIKQQMAGGILGADSYTGIGEPDTISGTVSFSDTARRASINQERELTAARIRAQRDALRREALRRRYGRDFEGEHSDYGRLR